MTDFYKIADWCLAMSGRIAEVVREYPSFTPFKMSAESVADFYFVDASTEDVPVLVKEMYSFDYEEGRGMLGFCELGYLFTLSPENGAPLALWTSREKPSYVYLAGNISFRLLRFSLWIGLGLLTYDKSSLAIHSSCVINGGKAILFLGESGTGKSTHTSLWCKHIAGASLLNDDSPIVRVVEGKLKVYGSPWSGKTACYKDESYELCACVRLSQAKYNRMERLNLLRSYAALHPSAPPQFAYDKSLYEGVSSTIEAIISNVPTFHLASLPDKEAAELSFNTIFGT